MFHLWSESIIQFEDGIFSLEITNSIYRLNVSFWDPNSSWRLNIWARDRIFYLQIKPIRMFYLRIQFRSGNRIFDLHIKYLIQSTDQTFDIVIVIWSADRIQSLFFQIKQMFLLRFGSFSIYYIYYHISQTKLIIPRN